MIQKAKYLPDKWLFTSAAVDNCVHKPCQNGATCVNGTGGVPYNCTCVSGWGGPNCDMGNFSFLQLFTIQYLYILSELRHSVGWFQQTGIFNLEKFSSYVPTLFYEAAVVITSND